MTGARIVLLGSTDRELQSWLSSHPKRHERGAFILFRRFDRFSDEFPASARFVAVDVIKMEDDWVLDSSPTHLRINMRKLPYLYFRCETENLELGFAHSHPSGHGFFSKIDDQNERNILKGYAGCNGDHVTLVALVLCDGKWIARTRTAKKPQEAHDARHISVAGENLRVEIAEQDDDNSEILKRQEAAFGKPFNRKLNSLRVVVVGAGGTGSPLATLLARSGVGELIIVDGDSLEESNLNRVRGYRKTDVGENKAVVLAAYINSIGLKTRALAIPEYLHESPAAIDAVSSADVIFGCTDDTAGRDILNQSTYYYALPLIDVDLTGRVHEDKAGEPYLADHRGRISIVLPQHGACLRCQRIVTDEKLAFQEAMKQRPELKELDAKTLREEYYLVGGGEQAPGVGPFTSMTADLAVAAFMNLIKPFWNLPSDLLADNLWMDFVHLCIHSNHSLRQPDCFCCGNNSVLLKAETGYRLDTPALGRIDRR